ncbi:MAG: ATP12 family protein [Alphaproteobacteria bacterium]
MRRFWKIASVIPLPEGYGIALDGKVLKTPIGHDYLCPTETLAQAIAGEWNAVAGKIVPRSMPMTQFAATSLDITAAQRPVIIDQVAAYAETDMLCYRAVEPPALVERQHEIWQPYLDWAAVQFGASLKTATGIGHVPQDTSAVGALRQAIEALDDFRLTALQNAASATGSLILGFALTQHWRGVEDIFAAAELDADYQAEKWGGDDETRARQEAVKAELSAIARFAGLIE